MPARKQKDQAALPGTQTTAELQDAAIGGLISGTLTITPYHSTGQDE